MAVDENYASTIVGERSKENTKECHSNEIEKKNKTTREN